jgi:putative ABC transport system permease protein
MMKFWEIFRMAIHALGVNRLRSILTLLGVIIGVTSVITIISALEGLSQSIKHEFDRLGPTTFIITKWGMITSNEAYWEALKRKPMKFEYVKAIEQGCEDCEEVSARINGEMEVKYRNRKISRCLIGGATAELLDIVDFEVGQGRFHSHEEDITRRRVAFIGTGVQDELYPYVDPIGKEIKIGGVKYQIIGIAKKRGSSFGNNMDAFVMIPFLSYVKDFGTPENSLDIFVKARSLAVMDRAMDETRVVLRAYRHVPYNKDDDFAMLTAESIMAVLNNITKYIRLGLVGVSSISLIVGGIIIMNIMMVSVTERTREIGIRKSIGARQKDILWQFLFESLVLSLGGGLIGIAAGVILGKVLIGLINMNMTPSLYAIALGLIISSGVGLFFGIYPAMKAARLQPVKALSFE